MNLADDRRHSLLCFCKINGLTGTLSWSANGEVSKAPAAYIIEGGKYVVS